MIVIDTNILLSFLIGKVLSNISKLFKEQEITIITSKEQMDELVDVLDRPKFKKYFSLKEKKTLLRLVKRRFEIVEIKEKVEVCRDASDNFILDIALNGGADYIITGDNDLLCLNPFKEIEIIKYQEFMEKLK